MSSALEYIKHPHNYKILFNMDLLCRIIWLKQRKFKNGSTTFKLQVVLVKVGVYFLNFSISQFSQRGTLAFDITASADGFFQKSDIQCKNAPFSGKVDEILGDLRDAKNQKGVAVLEDTVGNTMKKVTLCFDSFLARKIRDITWFCDITLGFAKFVQNYAETRVFTR